MIVFDNHLHLSPRGMGWKAVQDFEKRGGTHIMLANLPHKEASVLDTGSFKAQYDITLALAKDVRKNTNIGVLTSVGPYPVELIYMSEKIGQEKAVAKMREGMEIAANFVKEGRAQAIGEVGRPHFPVEPWVWEESNKILLYGMELAADTDCPVVVHCESATQETWEDLANMADQAGLARDKVIKHYSTPVLGPKENLGIFPSVLAGKDAVKKALAQGTRFMMETDFIDDPKRPGAVLAPGTVPKRTNWLLEQGLVSDSDIDVIHRKNPERMYNVELKEK